MTLLFTTVFLFIRTSRQSPGLHSNVSDKGLPVEHIGAFSVRWRIQCHLTSRPQDTLCSTQPVQGNGEICGWAHSFWFGTLHHPSSLKKLKMYVYFFTNPASSPFNPLSDTLININRCPDGAPHIHTHRGVSVSSRRRCPLVVTYFDVMKISRLEFGVELSQTGWRRLAKTGFLFT